jgi:nitrite reductase/ring-hydroxylating ferredoxin subunit
MATQSAELRLCAEFPIGEARVKGGNSGRKVLVVHGGDDQYYATDLHCFHMGGELGVPQEPEPGVPTQRYSVDIEDLHYLKCPMHGRKINLRTGEEAGDLGCKQRVHRCRVDNGFVLVDKRSVKHEDEQRFASDEYNTEKSTQIWGAMQAPRVRKATAAVTAKRAKQAPPSVPAPPSVYQPTLHHYFRNVTAVPHETSAEDTPDIDLTPGDGIDAQMGNFIDLTGEDLPPQPDDVVPPTQPYGNDLPPTQPLWPTQPDGDVDMG